jgi:uncharacterized membrane protein HdeD (DUF308 family)
MDASVSSSNLWWGLMVRGIVTLLFGVAAVFWPGLTLVTLVYIFSAYILVMGVFELISGVTDAGGRNSMWFLSLILGVIGIGVGIYLLRHPQVSFATLILLLGFTFIARGIIEVVQGFARGRMAGNRFLLLVGGALAFILGVIILMQPVSGGVAFVWVLGVYALITGPVLIALSLSEKEAYDAVVDGRTSKGRLA